VWSKFFAEEVAASGLFRSARLVFDPSEAQKEEIVISGTVLEAYFPFEGQLPSRLAVRLEARNKAGNSPFWEREISREVPFGKGFGEGCSPFSPRCGIDNFHGHHNRLLREIFREAARDLAALLAPRGGGGSPPPPAKAGGRTSVDEVIEDILERK